MSSYTVRIYYGPCDSFDTRAHKPQKLRGLKDRLQKIGYRVLLQPVEFENYCMLEMCGHEIFRCNINYLQFNIPYEYDVVAQRAIDAVVEATQKFQRARSYLWFWSLIEENMFRNNEYGPKEYWPQKPDLPPVTNCFNCPVCTQQILPLKEEVKETEKVIYKEDSEVAVINNGNDAKNVEISI